MSFILKALKKLENEKAARQTGKVEINSAILAPDRRSYSSPGNSPKRLFIALLVIAVSATSLYFMRRAPSPVVEQPLKEAQPDPLPRPVPVAATPVREDKPAPAVPTPSPAVKRQEGRLQPRRVVLDRPPESSPVVDGGSGSHPVEDALTGSASTALTVNGIALQDDPGKSMAVVNGQIVKRGMTVGGARVERIFLNRVRFRENGGMFDVHLAK
jgi:general secretion pathway protein B